MKTVANYYPNTEKSRTANQLENTKIYPKIKQKLIDLFYTHPAFDVLATGGIITDFKSPG